MRFWKIIVGLTLGLGFLNVGFGQQPGDAMQTKDTANLIVDGETAAVLPQGMVVTVEKSDKADPDKLWCRTESGLGWIARTNLMTCQAATGVWQEMINAGDVSALIFCWVSRTTNWAIFAGRKRISTPSCGTTPSRPTRSIAGVSPDSNWGRPRRQSTIIPFRSACDPGANSYGNRANARLVLGNGEGALADCNEALAIDPESLFVLVNRGSTSECWDISTKRSPIMRRGGH